MLGDPGRTRDVTAKVQAIVDGGERRFAAWRLGEGDDPALQTLKTLSVDYTVDGQPRKAAVLDGQTICLGDVARSAADGSRANDSRRKLAARSVAKRTIRTQDGFRPDAAMQGGRHSRRAADRGPWEVRFPAKTGAPESITLDKLISWSDHADAGVKYFSGTATYRKTFRLPPEALAAGRAVYLDLGRVAVIARVSVNGRDLGILWNAPFRVEATEALRAGDNLLEVQVTNLWVNRMIGDEQLPEDSRPQSRRLASVVAEVVVGGQAKPRRPAHVRHVSRLEKGLPVAGVGTARPREAVHDAARQV